MSAPTCLSLFSGGGLADLGLAAAGFTPTGAVEYDPAIAEVYRANLGDHIRCESVMDTDWRSFDRPDLLWASPECKEFSSAKTGGVEGPIQWAQADAICAALEILTPPLFVLENVVGYRRSDYSLPRICATLTKLGYFYDLTNVNAADFGVPQTRRRLILRAARDLLSPLMGRVARRRWMGWYAAIEDLLPTLPESAFAPWQFARLPEWLGESAYFMANDSRDAKNQSYGKPSSRLADDPAFVVTHNSPGWWKAFLVSDQRSNDGIGVGVRAGVPPALTVDTRAAAKTRAWLDQGRVVAMTPHALARFQSIPDSYILPESRGLACKVIGNGVPCLLAQRVGESLRGLLP